MVGHMLARNASMIPLISASSYGRPKYMPAV